MKIIKERSFNLKLNFPIKHIHKNLVFGRNGTVWAYFKVDGFSYDFLADSDKMIPFQNQMSFLTNTGLDLHFLVIPNPTDIKGILNTTIEEMNEKDYLLKNNGKDYMKQVKNILEEQKELTETSEYNHYLEIGRASCRERV